MKRSFHCFSTTSPQLEKVHEELCLLRVCWKIRCFRWFKKRRLDSAISLFWNKYVAFSPLDYGYRLWVCRDVLIVFVDLYLWAEKFSVLYGNVCIQTSFEQKTLGVFNVLLKCFFKLFANYFWYLGLMLLEAEMERKISKSSVNTNF